MTRKHFNEIFNLLIKHRNKMKEEDFQEMFREFGQLCQHSNVHFSWDKWVAK